MARTYHMMAALPNIDVEKNSAVLSNYKADIYETWQLWLERDVVRHIRFSFSICSLVFKLHKFKVSPWSNRVAKSADFCPQM